MPLLPVSPDDPAQVAALVEIRNAAQRVDDPEAFDWLPESAAGELRYGWDLQPEEHFLYVPDGADAPVATLAVDLPKRDNLHLFWLRLVVHPDHRRQGHGTAVDDRGAADGRAGRAAAILWVEAVEDDLGARKFVERFGFAYASHDARRRQRLADVDRGRVAPAVRRGARPRPPTTRLERLLPPVPDAILSRWSR